MNNLATLGVGRLVPVTVIGEDGHGYELLRALRELPIDASHVIQDRDRLTPTYTKPMKREASGEWRELNRMDFRSREPLTSVATITLAEHLRGVFDLCDGMIVLDQINETNWGVVNEEVWQVLRVLSQGTLDKLMLIDSRAHLGRFDFGILKGNRSELLGAAEEGTANAALHLAKRNGQHVFATVGETGILIATASGEVKRSPGLPVKGHGDIVGAGDSATSGIVASLLGNADPVEAADVGNLVASIQTLASLRLREENGC